MTEKKKPAMPLKAKVPTVKSVQLPANECLCIWEDDIEWCVKERDRLIEAAKAREAREAEEKRLAGERAREQREKWERERAEREAREKREREEREAKEERAAQQCQIDLAVHFMIRRTESRFLWRYLYLLLLSHGIFINDKHLIELGRQGIRERWEREWLQEEQRKAYREAYERIPQPERDAYRSGEIDAGSSFPKRCAQYVGQEPGVLDAYLAGFNRKPIPGLELKTNGAGGAQAQPTP